MLTKECLHVDSVKKRRPLGHSKSAVTKYSFIRNASRDFTKDHLIKELARLPLSIVIHVRGGCLGTDTFVSPAFDIVHRNIRGEKRHRFLHCS